MATYAELYPIMFVNNKAAPGSAALLEKVAVACTIAADIIRAGGDNVAPFDQTAGMHEKRVIWADQAFKAPDAMAPIVLKAVVAANESATAANILSATDAAIQSNVNAVIDVFALALGSPPA